MPTVVRVEVSDAGSLAGAPEGSFDLAALPVPGRIGLPVRTPKHLACSMWQLLEGLERSRMERRAATIPILGPQEDGVTAP